MGSICYKFIQIEPSKSPSGLKTLRSYPDQVPGLWVIQFPTIELYENKETFKTYVKLKLKIYQ